MSEFESVKEQNTPAVKATCRRMSGGRPCERGTALVEFTLVILPLLGFVFMLMDVAWILFGWACIQEGVREGVRYAVTQQSPLATCSGQDASIRQIVQQYSFGFVGSANQCGGSASVNSHISIQYYDPIDMQICTTAPCNVGGNVIKITISNVKIGSFGPILRAWTPILLGASSSDIMESCSINGCPPR